MSSTAPAPAANSSANAGPSHSQAEQITIEVLVQEIINASDPVAFAKYLRHYGSIDNFDTVLVSFLALGQDPLALLDVQRNTLGYLYILSSRLIFPNAAVPPIELISDFCERFNVEQARLAPERVTLLARGIVKVAEAANSTSSAIPILHTLLTRYNPSLSNLTPLHGIFVRICVSTRQFTAALPILSHRISDLMQPTPGSYGDLHYNDFLVYHYAGGLALAALRQWKLAEEFFELVVTCPALAAAAIQLEAFKKLALVQLIVYGKVKSTPKYAHPMPMRLWKTSAYFLFAQAYPSQIAALNTIFERESQLFLTDKNVGLMKQVLEYAPRWSIKKLTETYMAMSLSDIGREVGIADEEAVRLIVVSMIEQGEINATISADGNVTFEDPPPSFNKNEIEDMLRAAQAQSMLFAELDRQTGRSKDYLNKVLSKGRDEGPWGTQDEEMYRGDKESWGDETIF